MYSFQPRTQWTSYYSYMIVTIGAIVGLGNFFQFPFLAAKYGGLFLLFHLLCEFAIAMPILFAELLIGRRGKQNPVGAISILAMETGASPLWKNLGWLSIFLVFLTLSYYTVAAAFPVGYFIDSIKEISTQGVHASVANIDSFLMSNFFKLEFCFILFLALALYVVYRGINRGLETISHITVPLYLLILVVLAIYTASRGNFMAAVEHLFKIYPDVDLVPVFLIALAFSFLKLKIGMGIMIVYGSYLPYEVPLGKSTFLIVCIDIVVSLLSYFILYPLMLESNPDVFINGITQRNVIHLFTQIPYGLIVAAFFFFATIIGAWTPIIAMAETFVVTLVERINLSRKTSVLLLLVGVFILGSLQTLNRTVWVDVMAYSNVHLYSVLKVVTTTILLPASVLLLVVFVGYILKRKITANELSFNTFAYSLWRFFIRYIIPICLLIDLFTVTILQTLTF